jgi:hypothetical protein
MQQYSRDCRFCADGLVDVQNHLIPTSQLLLSVCHQSLPYSSLDWLSWSIAKCCMPKSNKFLKHLLLRTFYKLNQNFSSQTHAQHCALLAKRRTIFSSKGFKGFEHPPALSCSTRLPSKRQEVTQTFFGELPSRFAWCDKPLAWAPQTCSFDQVLVTLPSLPQAEASRVFLCWPFCWKCWYGLGLAPRWASFQVSFKYL